MEYVVLVLAILFFLWRLNSANDEALEDYEGQKTTDVMSSKPTNPPDYEYYDSGMGSSAGYESSSFDDHYRRWHDDHCDISRAMWDPSCPMYHVFHHDDWSSSSSWDDSWSSSSWDDSWSSSSWDSWSGSSSWDS